MTAWLLAALRGASMLLLCASLVACGDDGNPGDADDDDDLVDDAGTGDDDDDDDDVEDDAGTGDPPNTITCAETTCEVGDEACCATPGDVTSFACIATGGACAGGTMACDGPEDCGDGEVCCIRFGGGALPNGACEAEATCTGAGTSKGCGGAGGADCGPGEVCCNDPAFGLSSDFCWPGACP